MKSLFLTLIHIFAFCNLLFAQPDFQKGFIIQANGDTILGFVKSNSQNNSLNYCEFTTEINDRFERYGPNEISVYGITNGNNYISKEIPINGKLEKRFLEILFLGSVDLYFYAESGEKRFFIQKEGLELFELKETEKLVTHNGVSYLKKSKSYIGYLKLILSDAPTLSNKIDAVSLGKKPLIKLFGEYHNLVSGDSDSVNYSQKQEKATLSFGPIIGISRLTLNPMELFFKSILSEHSYFNADYSPSTNINFGLTATLSLPKPKNRCEFVYKGQINSYNLSSQYKVGNVPSVVYYVPYTINSVDLVHDFLFRINFTKMDIKPMLEGGVFISQNLKMVQTGLNQLEYLNEIFPKTNSYGFTIGIGFATKISSKSKLFISLNYSKGFDTLEYFNTDKISFQLGIPIFSL